MEFKKLHLDYETRSVCDLRKTGLHTYATHPTTDIMIASYAFDDDDVYIWRPGAPCPSEIVDHICRGGQVVAHNVYFEIAITNNVAHNRYNWPKIHISQCSDTMVRGYAMGLPGALKNLAPALGIKEAKDMTGNRLMLQMSKPRKGPLEDCKDCKGDGYIFYDDKITKGCALCECIEWWDDPEKQQKLEDYGIQDVEVERLIDVKLLELSPSETKLWHLDFKINEKGIYVDKENALKAKEIIETHAAHLNKRVREVSNNAIATCNAVKQTVDFLKDHGVITKSIAKSKVVDILQEPNCPPIVTEVLLLRQEAAKTSTRKLATLIDSVGEGGRIRGILQFLGAHSTGRWAGRRLQVQNLPRPSIPQSEILEIFEILESSNASYALEQIEMLYGPPLQMISDCLRGFICAPPGKTLISCDFSSIESRVLAWLAGEEAKLIIFRGHGKVYEDAASSIYHIPLDKVSKDQRQIGKVAELALGYQGGVGAFQSMAKNYGVKVPDKQAEEIKNAWRENNPEIVRFWHKTENAALKAVSNKGQVYASGATGRRVKFKVNGSFLFCQLPSKRTIVYPYPSIQNKETPWGHMKDVVCYKGVDGLTNKWVDKVAYGGLYCENITQATARDLLAHSLLKLDHCGKDIVMHIHDEIVLEVDEDEDILQLVENLMCENPTWAKGLPIAAEGYVSPRFKK